LFGPKSSLRATRISATSGLFVWGSAQTGRDEATTQDSGAVALVRLISSLAFGTRSALWPTMTREALIELLQNSDGHVTRAANTAGIERQSLHRLLKRHGIEPSHYRPRGGRGLVARVALYQLRRTTMQRALGGDAAVTDSGTTR
jgi:hypothetical protein